MKQLGPNIPVEIINMADWVLSKQTDGDSTIRVAFSDKIRLSRRKPGNTGRLNLTLGQRRTILNHISLPDDLFARLIIEEFGHGISRFTVEQLNDLQNTVGEAAHYAKGFVRWKLMRVVENLSDIRSTFPKSVHYRFYNNSITALTENKLAAKPSMAVSMAGTLLAFRQPPATQQAAPALPFLV